LIFHKDLLKASQRSLKGVTKISRYKDLSQRSLKGVHGNALMGANGNWLS